ncbi:ABC transporter permease [candidate division KSB1 bacterium]|nr:ABC transporter permease [candidate division KSB1 bacterium]
MLKNYLHIALRHLWRHKGYAALNVAGLAIGMTCCVLILLYVRQEWRYDRFHEKADRIYRFVSDDEIGGGVVNLSTSPGAAAAALKREFSEVQQAVRFFKLFGGEAVVNYGEKRFWESRFFFGDAEVFEVFSFPLLAGNPQTALIGPKKIVITQTTAQKYFGAESPLGKTIALGDSLHLEVTGVIAGLPTTTHLRFDFLASMPTLDSIYPGLREDWISLLFYTYVVLPEGYEQNQLAARLKNFAQKYDVQGTGKRAYALEPLRDIHLYSARQPQPDPAAAGDITYVYVFSAIAVLILLIACINFMNLATARATKRLKEIGVRKVLGAERAQLLRQFLAEAIVLAGAALLATIGLLEFLLPVFNGLTGKQIALHYARDFEIAGGLAALTLLAGIFAGSYPAFYLSGLCPLAVWKAQAKSGAGNFRVRELLVVFQFTISIALIAGTMIVFEQMEFVRSKNLGFDQENVVVFPIGFSPAGQNVEAMKQALLQNSNIANITISMNTPGSPAYGLDYRLEGKPAEEISNVTTYLVDYDFLPAYAIGLTAGRNFSKEHATDLTQAFMINEAAAKQFGWDKPLGKAIEALAPTGNGFQTITKGTVIGVLQDYHFGSLKTAIQPAIFRMWKDWSDFNTISIRARPQNVQQTLAFLESTWQIYMPTLPFRYFFLDEQLAALYQQEEKLGNVTIAFAGLAILIACLGLFGLSAFVAEQRTKEIGIRKALGASVSGLVMLLNKESAVLVLIANIIAWPIAYFAMNRWLADFAYRISIGPAVFVIAGALAFMMAWLTMSFQTVRAARANPINSLRYE